MGRGNKRTASKLHQAVIDGARYGKVADLAARMGVSPSLVYAWCDGRERFDLERLPSLYLATGDLALVTELSGLGAVGLTISVDPQAATADSVYRQAAQAGAAVGRAQAAACDAVTDGVVTEAEARAVDEAKESAERELETLSASVRRLRVGSG